MFAQIFGQQIAKQRAISESAKQIRIDKGPQGKRIDTLVDLFDEQDQTEPFFIRAISARRESMSLFEFINQLIEDLFRK